jgi:Fe-Mn family superoxide dismutase
MDTIPLPPSVDPDSLHGLLADAAQAAHPLLLDVRRAGAFAQADSMIPGATWHDPARVAEWAGLLPRDRDIVVYCVHGHEVSQATAQWLHAGGWRVRYLRGGIQGWQQAGLPVAGKVSAGPA